MKTLLRIVACIAAIGGMALASSVPHARAQVDLDIAEIESNGSSATPEEREAWLFAEAGRHIKAREMADTILRKHPESFVANLVIGYVNH